MIKISSEGLERAEKALSHIKGAFNKAVASATNRTLEGMRTDAVKETSQKYFAKSSEIRKTITLKKSSAGDLGGAMVSSGKRKTLADYQLTPKTPKKRIKGVQGAVKQTGLKSISDAFLVRRGGKYIPYTRKGTGKWNIQSLVSPAIPQIIKNEDTVKVMEEKAEERFSKRLDHEVLCLIGALS